MATLNDIPYEVFVGFLLPLITLKEVGSLSWTSSDLRSMCENEEVWEILYLRTIRGNIPIERKIPHVGPLYYRRYRSIKKFPSRFEADQWIHLHRDDFGSYGRIRYEYGPIVNMHRVFTGYLISGKKFPGFEPIELDVPNSETFNHGFRIGDLRSPGCIMCWSSLPKHLHRRASWSYGGVGTCSQVKEFSEEIKKEWIEYNRSKGLSTVNLCQCPEHYQSQDLDCGSSKRNFKSYKKTVLKKQKTSQKHSLRALSEKKEKKLLSNIQNLEKLLKKAKQDYHDFSQEKSRLIRLGESLENAIQ